MRPFKRGREAADKQSSTAASGEEKPSRVKTWFARSGGALADKAVLGAMKGPSRYPKLPDYKRVQKEVRSAHEYYKGLGILDEPHRFHRDPPPLSSPEVRRHWYPGLHVDWLSFPSEYRPYEDCCAKDRWLSYARNHIAHAFVLRHPDTAGPNPKAQRPWLICLHGLGMGSPFMDLPSFKAVHLHRTLGLNVVFPVLPLHGPRETPKMLRGSLLSYDLLNSLHGMGQAVWDVRRIISWIREQGGEKIGLYGVSLGAYTASLVSAFEDLDMVLAGIPVCDVPTLFASHSPADHQEMAIAHDVLGDKVQELYRMVSPASLGTKPRHDRRYIVAGTEDRISMPAQAELLWDAWDQPRIEWFPGGHVSYFWSKVASRFVDATLEESGFRYPPSGIVTP